MKMKIFISKLLITFLVMMSANSYAASKPAELVENFDLRYYHPQINNLKDLAFKIRISNLKENVLKSIPLSKLDDLYYSVFWITPGRYHVEVHGLPTGYTELKNELKALIQNRLDFVLPQKLAPKVRSYSLKSTDGSSESLKIEGVDKTHQRGINKIEIEFDKKGKLKSFVTKSPMGSQKSVMSMSPKSWSKNKWVVDNITIFSTQGLQTTKMKNELIYKNYDGFGFPEKVIVTTTQEFILRDKKRKKKKRTIKTEIIFSDYVINKGVAKKRIMDARANAKK